MTAAERRRVYYLKNREAELAKTKAAAQEKRGILSILKRLQGCSRCGYSKCAEALEFHHRDPDTKTMTISKAVSSRSLKGLLEETRLCDVLCTRCHAELHAEDRRASA